MTGAWFRSARRSGRVRGCIAGAWLSLLAACVTVDEGPTRAQPTVAERLAAQLDLGRGYLRAGDLAKAKAPLLRAVELDAASWEAHDLLANLYQLEGESELADRHFRTAIRNGGGARSRNNYGAFLSSLGRLGEACEQFRRAVDDTGYANRAQAFENLGLCERARGNAEAARAAFVRAVTLGGTHPESLLELADLHFEAARYAEARAAYDQFRAVGRQTPRSLLLGIRIGRALEDRDAEASFALMLRNMFPDSSEYRRYREMTQ